MALRPLTLSIEEGETFGFLGPNGAGKTTTLKLLMGLIRPTCWPPGSWDGVDDLRVKAQMFLPEQPYFYDYLTARELLGITPSSRGFRAKERSARVSAMLERVGLKDSGEIQLRKFSKGMLQSVGHGASHSARSRSGVSR